MAPRMQARWPSTYMLRVQPLDFNLAHVGVQAHQALRKGEGRVESKGVGHTMLRERERVAA